MKKVFILKSKNSETGKVEMLSSCAYKDYSYAVETLKDKLIETRYELQQEKYNNQTDMTEIVKGFIEVYETSKGQAYETFKLEPVKVYNYNF